MDNIIPEHKLRYYKTIKAIQADHKVKPANLTWTEGNPPNLWIYGPTGMINSLRIKIKSVALI